MKGPHNIIRLIRTGATLERTGAMDVVLEAFRAPPRLRFAARMLGWPFKWLGLQGDLALPPATRALTALGPAYIKFGQVLSTRPDVVGEELAQQLKYLQDKLPPFPTEIAKRMIEAELEQPVSTIFAEFSEPVAGRLDRASAPGPAGRHGRRGGRQGPPPRHRARVPKGHRRLLPGRSLDRTACPVFPAACVRSK